MAFAESMVWGSVPDLVVVAREKEFPGHAFTGPLGPGAGGPRVGLGAR